MCLEPFVFEAARENVVMKDKPPDKEDNVQTKKKISFRDILIEGKQKTQVKERFDLIEKGSIKISYEGGNRLLPKVTLDDTYFHELCHPWNDALVIKLLGKNGGYYVLKERLKKLWKLTRSFEIMDIDQGFYMVKCDMLANGERMISGGPRMLFDNYLVVSQWSPEFASCTAKVKKSGVC